VALLPSLFSRRFWTRPLDVAELNAMPVWQQLLFGLIYLGVPFVMLIVGGAVVLWLNNNYPWALYTGVVLVVLWVSFRIWRFLR
jgi:hypothetical protein